jgi:hypothetical protein
MLTPEERALITDMKDRLIELYVERDEAARPGTAIEFVTGNPRSSTWPRRQSCPVVDPFPQARGYWSLFLQKGPLASGKRGHLQPMMLRAGKS